MKYIQRNKPCLKCLCLFLTFSLLLGVICLIVLLIFNSNPCMVNGANFKNHCQSQCCMQSCSNPISCQSYNQLLITIPLILTSVFGFIAFVSGFLCCFCRCKTQKMPLQAQLQRLVELKRIRKMQQQPQNNKNGFVVVNEADSNLNMQQVVYYKGKKIRMQPPEKNYQQELPVVDNNQQNSYYSQSHQAEIDENQE